MVVFRADASIEIGAGHVMRCLTLADTLYRSGMVCHFICREHQGNLITLIENRGYEVTRLPLIPSFKPEISLAHSEWLGSTQKQDAITSSATIKRLNPDLLVVDHYALDIEWEQLVQPFYRKLMVIDDLADRQHCADILLDQNYGRLAADYENLVPKTCQLLLGPKHALIRPEFAQWRERSIQRRKKIKKPKNWLISLGGTDKDNITLLVLTALHSCNLDINSKLIVVMGPTAPHINDVRRYAAQMSCPCELLVNVSNMAELMANADIAIGAAGSTSWERCCLGLPSIVFSLAANQNFIIDGLSKSGISIQATDKESLIEIVNNINSSLLSDMTKSSSEITQGDGSQIVTNHIINSCLR